MGALKLTACMKVVAKMGEMDQESLLERLDRYTSDGVPKDRAQVMAASDTLAELIDERREFMAMLREQHPDLFRVTNAIPEDQDVNPDEPDIKRSAARAVENLVGRAASGAAAELDARVSVMDAIDQVAAMNDAQAIEVDKLENEISRVSRLVSGMPDTPRRKAIAVILDKVDSEIEQAIETGTMLELAGKDGANARSLREELAMASGDIKRSPARDITDTTEFKRWFGDSEVVDADGKPLVMYHSTYSDVAEFKTNFGDDEYSKFGVHVGSLEAAQNRIGIKAAEDGAQGARSGNAAPNIMPLYVRAESPLRLDENRSGRWGIDDILRAIIEKAEAGEMVNLAPSSDTVQDYYDDNTRLEYAAGMRRSPNGGRRWQDVGDWAPGERSRLLKLWIKSLGHDSIVYKNDFEGGGDSYILLDSEQVKSATGNRGTFDPNDADITRSPARDLTDTPEFKRWFGDSKAVEVVSEATGLPPTSSKEKTKKVPQVMYHTTRNDFSEFEVGRTTVNSGTFGDWETTRSSVFVTPELEASQAYGKRGRKFAEGANVMPLYIKAENPLDLTGGVIPYSVELQFEGIDFNPRWLYQFDWSKFDGEEGADFVRAAKQLGYDSVIFNDENPETGDSFEAWAVFSPTQIKSAIGNNGQFDPGNADITRSPARQTEMPEFKKWFDDSVMTEDGQPGGKPMTLYHGGFNFVDAPTGKAVPKVSGRGALGAGFYMTPSEELASDYAYENGGVVNQVYARIKRPLEIRNTGSQDPAVVALEMLGVPRAKAMSMTEKAYEKYGYIGNEIKSRALDAGYDGLARYSGNELVEVVVWTPTQVKSVTDNDGQFSWNPDIRRSPARAQEDTPEFKAWFSDSKVVDEDGRPMVVYHGTIVRPDTDRVKSMGDIQAFDRMFTTQFRKPSLDTVGSWFSTNPGDGGAEMYSGRGPGSAIYPAYLSIQNPQVTTFQLMQRRARLLANGKDDGRQIGAEEVDAYRKWLQDTGKDGIKIEGSGNDGSTEFDNQVAWIALEPEQIKSATGNRGTFDPNDADITRSPARDLNERTHGSWSVYTERSAKIGDAYARWVEDDSTLYIIDLQATGKTRGRTALQKLIDATGKELYAVGVVEDSTGFWDRMEEDGLITGQNDENFVDFFSIRRSPGRTATGAAWDSPSAEKFDDLVYKLQDKLVDTKRVVEAIKTASGAIADDLNVYLQEELYHGRAAKRTEDFVNMELNPLIEQMAKDGLKLEDVEEFMHARHAPEANKVIAQRNPGVQDLQDGGSGMETGVALNYMATLPADLKRKLEAAAAKVDAIIAKTRELYVDYELESRDTVDGWGKVFQHYIPLQREDKNGSPGLGQGFSVKGKETKGRTGSTRKVVDIMANIALQRERAIVRGEKNRVSQALVGLATANPNEGFWQVDEVPTERVFNEKTGLVEDRVDPLYKSRENAVIAKIKGADGKVKEHAVLFNEEDPRALRMAQALKNLDANQIEGLLGVSAKITRYFAAINTQYNPVFGAVNLVRDVQGALLNLSSTPLAGEQAKIGRYTMSALRGIYADARAARKGNSPTSQWAALWDEFQEVGGQTGYRDLFRTSEDRANAIKDTLNPDAWADSRLGKIFTANGALKVPLAQAKRGAGWIFQWLSDYNLAMENGVRLAAYKAGLEKGMSKEQAASAAKNITVNFNRKGQVSQQAGAMYAFFNASLQGTARLGQTLFDMEPGKPKTIRLSSTGKKIVYGGIMLGSIQALALAAAGFNDDDPPEFARERGLIIPIGGKKYVTIPMPLGFHVIPNIGRIATEFALSGFKDPHERALSLASLFADTFNPIGNSGLSMQTLAPTALDPLVALTENKDWTGKPIARESSNKAIPGHALGRDTASSIAKFLSEGINTLSGGNKYVAGVFSPTPDQIDYLLGQVTGGVGRELSKVEQTVLATARGEDLPTYKVPLVGRFVGDAKSQASEGAAFYANTERLNKLETEIKGLEKDGKRAEAAELRRNSSEAYLITVANQAERQIQRLRAEKRELVKAGAPREQVKAVEERITAVMSRLNRAAETLREKQEN